MKFNKIYAIALAALTLTACSDDDDNGLNSTSGVTVQMQQSTMSVSEDMQQGVYYKVPIVVTGEANGPVEVTVDVQCTGTTPATEDEHYVITDKTITIDADTQIGYVEFYPKGDDVINDDRQFIVTITGAKGATIGTESTCIVTLVDNEGMIPRAYESVLGQWNLNGSRPCVLTINGFDADEEGYGKTVYISGWAGYSFVIAEGNFNFDASSMQATVVMNLGQKLADVEFTGLGVCDVVLCIAADGKVYNGGTIEAAFDSEYTNATFDISTDEEIYFGVFQNGSYMGVWMRFTAESLTKVQ